MAHMKYILRHLPLLAGILLLGIPTSYSQTCCSGGVPLSGNIGFEGAGKGTLQMEVSYDLNYLATLKTGAEIFEGGTRGDGADQGIAGWIRGSQSLRAAGAQQEAGLGASGGCEWQIVSSRSGNSAVLRCECEVRERSLFVVSLFFVN